MYKNKEKQKANRRQWYLKRIEQSKAYARQYYQEHKEQCRARARRYHQEHKEQLNIDNRQYRQEHKEYLTALTRQRYLDRKKEVLIHYGNGRLACVRCGFDDIRALTVDHIAGGGNKHRKVLAGLRFRFYWWLQKQGYPEGYQTLCSNCQMIKKTENKEVRQ